jgi:hypothetical protein
MTIKMYQVIGTPVVLQKLKSQKLSFKTAYKLTLLAQEVEKHVAFYQESFRNLIMEYSKKDEEGNPVPTEDGQGVQLMEETTEEAYQKLAELRDLDVELPDAKFSVDDFGNVEISADEMIMIMPFIEA